MPETVIRIGCATALAIVTLGVSWPDAAPSDAHAALARGIEALHYFEYEEANEAFREAHRRDGALVVACWGEAMTFHQTLWRNEDVQQARNALAACGPTPEARAAKASTPKDRMYLAAADSLFGEASQHAIGRHRYPPSIDWERT